MSDGDEKGHKSLTSAQKRAIARKAAKKRIEDDLDRSVKIINETLAKDFKSLDDIDVDLERKHEWLAKQGLCMVCNQVKDHARMNRESDGGYCGTY